MNTPDPIQPREHFPPAMRTGVTAQESVVHLGSSRPRSAPEFTITGNDINRVAMSNATVIILFKFSNSGLEGDYGTHCTNPSSCGPM